MRIRFVGLLTEAQVAKGLAGYKTIKPAKGIFIKGGLSYTFTFKNGVASAVTIRRAPVITILDEPDADNNSSETSFDEKYASFDDNYGRVVWVKSNAEATELLEMANDAGYKWKSGDNILSFNLFNEYGELAAYCFNAKTKRVQVAGVEWYRERGSEVVEFKG